MKRAVVAIFALFYLAVSSGFTVHLHYCMNRLAGWGLIHSNKDKCGVCGMHKGNAKGCCEDKHQVVKFTHDQKLTDNTFVKIQKLNLSVPEHEFPGNTCTSLLNETWELYNLPPPHLRSIPLFICFCNYRI